MARKRYISTEISIDTKLNRVSDLAALLYSWMVPHAGDNCRLSAKNAEELRLSVMPGRRRTDDEIEGAVAELIDQGLIGQEADGRYFFPAESFYKYQSYIKPGNRAETLPANAANRRKTPEISEDQRESPENTGDQRESPENTGDQRETPENTTSFPLSLPLSLPFLKAGRSEAPAVLETDQEAEAKLSHEPPKAWFEPLKRMYEKQPRRMALLFAWCVAAENKRFTGAQVADALAELERHELKNGPVGHWARYLDTIIDRRTVRANARDHETAHAADKEQEGAWAKRIFATT